jgi:2-phosphosulfolactate phosphatase
MRTVDVCLTPDLLHQYELAGKNVVVVDILRATSCMVTGMAVGVAAIKPVASLEECADLKKQGYTTAAERNGAKAEGFDMGNSPFEYMQPKLKGNKVAVTTTNGTLAISKSVDADEIIIGAFLNLTAVANYLLERPQDVIILCAGWKGKFNLEDTLFAGALVQKLTKDGQFEYACDAALAAEAMYKDASTDLMHYMRNSSHAKRLGRLGVVKDIEFCAQHDTYAVVPRIQEGELVI